ncbi:MAG: tetratricopeptide repeat protein [Deltaproteobacteria bacterium]|nr:tetratricopeptide repeat protein [Deltaproteobacteria bacterium]
MTNRDSNAGPAARSSVGRADDADVLVAGASEALAKRSPETAIALLEGAVRIDPGNGRAYWLLGTARRELGQVPLAIEAYERAISLDEENEVIPVELVELYAAEGQADRGRALATWLLSTTESPALRRRVEAALRALEGATH